MARISKADIFLLFFFLEQKMQLFKKKEQEMAQKEARLQKAENDLKIKHAELKVLLV